jgi:pimeloyl-ACP methyl ester carboxylesterase
MGEIALSLFVVVHGSWHDGTLLEPVVRQLERAGHRALAPTLAGHGKSSPAGIGHDECVESLVGFLVENDLRDVVLVGHSFAGTVISRAAPLCADRLRRLVFWNAFVLRDGECLNDAVPPHYRAMFDAVAASTPDNMVMLPFPVWREAFMNDASLDEAKAAYQRLSPEFYGLFTEKLQLRDFYALIHSGRIGCSYINCTDDISLPQTPEGGWHPRMSGRLGLCRIIQTSGSHEVLFTNPPVIARAIIAAGRD